jgi:hypothetical protein
VQPIPAYRGSRVDVGEIRFTHAFLSGSYGPISYLGVSG